MPTVLEKINKILYTQTEIDIVSQIEEVIFKINIQSNGQFTNGAKFSDIQKELKKKKIIHTDEFILNLLRKLKKEFVLQEIDGKWYSCLM